MEDAELVDQCMTFLVAGHETTAVALTWAAWLLARHPAREARLVDELHAHARQQGEEGGGDGDGRWSMAGLARLPYLDAVCKEALRLFPPAPLTFREAAADDALPGGTRVAKGTVLFLSPGVMGRLPRFWGDDADAFRPERWLGAATKGKAFPPPFAFLPFLAGERGCIGQRFALLEMKAVLAALLPRFALACVAGAPDPRPRLHVTLRPVPHLRMVVRRRCRDNEGKKEDCDLF